MGCGFGFMGCGFGFMCVMSEIFGVTESGAETAEGRAGRRCAGERD